MRCRKKLLKTSETAFAPDIVRQLKLPDDAEPESGCGYHAVV